MTSTDPENSISGVLFQSSTVTHFTEGCTDPLRSNWTPGGGSVTVFLPLLIFQRGGLDPLPLNLGM